MPNDLFQESFQIDPCVECGPIWQALTSDPGLGVAIMGSDGTYLYINRFFASFFHRTPAQMMGQRLDDIHSPVVAREVQGVLDRVLATDNRVVKRVMWDGRCIQITHRCVSCGPAGIKCVLVTAKRGYEAFVVPDDVETSDMQFVELGPLDVLSARELEVLALLGEGLRLRDIATLLARSPKTIDSHIRAVRRKLKTTDRAVLMRIALEAGLDRSVVNKTRVLDRTLDGTGPLASSDSAVPSGS